MKQKRAVDGARSKIPTLKFLTPPSTHKSHPGAGLCQQNENSVHYVFNLSFVSTHTKLGIKIFKIDVLTIFDLLTSPQGHQIDPRMKILLAFCSARHPRRFDMPHDHVWIFLPWAPQRPKVPPLGHDLGDRLKIASDIFCFFQL